MQVALVSIGKQLRAAHNGATGWRAPEVNSVQ